MKRNAQRMSRTRIVMRATLFALCLLTWLAEPLAAQSDGAPSRPAQFLPLVLNNGPQAPEPIVYDAVTVDNIDSCRADGRAAAQHGDLNLAVRGYEPVAALLELVDYAGDTDLNAPQLAGIFAEPRLPAFTGAYQVYDWDWGCGEDGCRGPLLAEWPVTLLEMAASPGEALSIPSRSPRIDGAGHKALVLYAASTRLTLVYTRHDSAACGYVVHLEDIRVEPSLVSFYEELNAAGRSQLPGLDNGERLGSVSGTSLKVAVRDTGRFLDPRARKDWWQAY